MAYLFSKSCICHFFLLSLQPKLHNWMSKQLQIRNSTAEFLIFQAEDKAQGVQVFYKDETIWATQKAMATLFDCSTDNIGVHLNQGIFQKRKSV